MGMKLSHKGKNKHREHLRTGVQQNIRTQEGGGGREEKEAATYRVIHSQHIYTWLACL
jgi:hypothetical protein